MIKASRWRHVLGNKNNTKHNKVPLTHSWSLQQNQITEFTFTQD